MDFEARINANAPKSIKAGILSPVFHAEASRGNDAEEEGDFAL